MDLGIGNVSAYTNRFAINGDECSDDVGRPTLAHLEHVFIVVIIGNDALVPASESQLIHKAWFDSRLMLLEGGGHQRVLADPRLSDAVLELLARAEAVSVGAASAANIGIAGATHRGV